MTEKDKKEPKKAGRKAINIDLDEVRRLAGLGLSERQIAVQLGVSWSTLHRNKKRLANFETNLRQGRQEAISKVANSLYKNAVENNNIEAQKFFLKARDKENWQDQEPLIGVELNLNNILKSARDRIAATNELPEKLVIDKNLISSTHEEPDKLPIKKIPDEDN